MMPWLRRPWVAGGVVWYRAYVCSCLFERRRSWSDCWPQLPDIGHVATPAMLNLAAGGVPAVKFDQERFSDPHFAAAVDWSSSTKGGAGPSSEGAGPSSEGAAPAADDDERTVYAV